jgi:hypothetical protein
MRKMAGADECLLSESQLFTAYEQEPFTRVVARAKRGGKPA